MDWHMVKIELFQKQPMMRKVIYSLIPLYLFALFFYGLHLLWLSVFVFIGGYLTEYFMEKRLKKKVTEAVLITCMLFLLSLPPMTPWWVALAGIVFAVLFGKEVFGGFGRNPFNPAITGRLFIYISFPGLMVQGWLPVEKTWKLWENKGWDLSTFFQKYDAFTSATPLEMIRSGNPPSFFDLIFGFKNGSMGEGMIILIILAAIYLIWTKTASWKIMLSTLLGAAAASAAFFYTGIPKALDPLTSLLSGSLLFVAVFMATDPVSAPKREGLKWIYGLMIGMITIVVRTFSLFPEGVSFALLIANILVPFMEEVIPNPKKVKT
jgi:Na+-transporting NADH:ubiquinone oxidoreductase subunit B